MPLFTNFYRHCGIEWQDEWDGSLEDQCPACGAVVEPYAFAEVDEDE